MPTMDAAKRGSGPSIAVIPESDRPVEDGRPWHWTCKECPAQGWHPTFRAAQNAIDVHQWLRHRAGAP